MKLIYERKIHERKMAVFVLLLCLGLWISGCAGSASDTKQETPGAGQVFYLNMKPEVEEQWNQLASLYTEQTGVPVKVVTSKSDVYEETLEQAMESEDKPTMFQVNNRRILQKWAEACYNLSDSEIYKRLKSDRYVMKNDAEVSAIAFVIESYGIIVNRRLLEKAGYEPEQITSFGTLKKVSEEITARKEELGFAAFTSSGMDLTSDWRFKSHLASVPLYFEGKDSGSGDLPEKLRGSYLEQFRSIWDLYLNNSTCRPIEIADRSIEDAREEFLEERAVFYQNGSWEFTPLVVNGPFTEEDLMMIPIYIGVGKEENQGLCTGTENYWCVNKNVKQEDIRATLDFMDWCVNSPEGKTVMTEQMGFYMPFQGIPDTPNIFMKQNTLYEKEGKVPVDWSFTTTPSTAWRDQLGDAMLSYAMDPRDGAWENVRQRFTVGWEKETLEAQNLKAFGVFLEQEKADMAALETYRTLVIDAQKYSASQIQDLHNRDHVVYSYLNVGSLENWRPYYEEFQAYTLGECKDRPKEYWMDVTEGDWQRYLVNTIARDFIEKHIDGLFIAHTDVYEMTSSRETKQALIQILEGLGQYRIPIMISGGDAFVKEMLEEDREDLFAAILKESAFTGASIDELASAREYLALCKENGKKVYVLEHTADQKEMEEIREYCDEHDYNYYFPDRQEFN